MKILHKYSGKMIRLSGLWKNVSDKGEKYLSGNIGSGKILIFKNKNKQTESDADYIMYVTDDL